MQATIYDIAREAGVSIATVSRVFNNSSTVSPKTRDRVTTIAHRLGYHPHALAQGLAKKRTQLITAIVPVLSNHFFMEVLAGIQDRLADSGFDLNIYNVRMGDSLESQIDHLVKRGSAEGYLFISTHLPEKIGATLRRMGVPMVLIDDYHPDFDSVSVDSVEGAYLATKYLVDSGNRRVGMIAASPRSKPTIDRVRGFKRALEDSGRLIDEALIMTGDTMDRDGFTERNGYEAMRKLLDLPVPPDACFCSSDIQAIGALKALAERGVQMPIVGFDDIQFARFLGLSTMCQPMYQMGFLALEKLLRRIGDPATEISHTVFSPQLVVRNTAFVPVVEPDADVVVRT